MSMIELENPEEHAIYQIYLELIDVWMDKMEEIISFEEGNKNIDAIIKKMKDSLETFPHETFMLKYFFINGEGWKNYHPFNLENMTKEDKQKIVGIRTGEIRFFNPDVEFLNLNIKEGTADEVLQEVLNKTRNYKDTSTNEIEEDYNNISNMEKVLKDMEESLKKEKETQSEEDKIMEELLQNDEVKKIYQNIKEGKMKEEEKQNTEETENIKDEAEASVEDDIKETKEDKDNKTSLTIKIAIGVATTALLAGAGYFLKNKYLNK